MDSFHLNEYDTGSVCKTNIMTMQANLYNNENKKFIVDILFFLEPQTLKSCQFDNSVFLISNFSINNRKYSDNLTFVLSSNDITEISSFIH